MISSGTTMSMMSTQSPKVLRLPLLLLNPLPLLPFLAPQLALQVVSDSYVVSPNWRSVWLPLATLLLGLVLGPVVPAPGNDATLLVTLPLIESQGRLKARKKPTRF
jgi:hypothetical protein